MTPDEWRTRVGRRIEEARGQRSVRSIADEAGVSEGLWRQMESGRRPVTKDIVRTVSPRPASLAAVSRALGWRSDGVQRLVDGLEPETMRPEDHPLRSDAADAAPSIQPVVDSVEDLRRQLISLRRDNEAILRRLDELATVTANQMTIIADRLVSEGDATADED